jgi:hypothetical protein
MSQKANAIPLPCPILSREIGLLETEILRTRSPYEIKKLEKILASLQSLYRTQCEHALAPNPGFSTTAHKFGEGLLLNIVEANGVRVIFGGNDGILVTIDGAGHIHVYGPDGPGDPVLRNAVTAVLQGMNTLSATAIGAQAA